MREGWNTAKLGDVIEIQSGFAFRSAEYSQRGHFLIRIGNVQSGGLSLDKPKYVNLDSRTRRFELDEGDIVTSLTGNIGRVAVVQKHHLPAALNQRVARLVVKDSKRMSWAFLYYFLTSEFFRRALNRTAHGVAQKNVSPKAIERIPVELPPLPEQKRIVAILDEAFAGIATAVANTEKNLANARELFESYLRVLFETICRERGTVRLGDVCKTGSGGTPRKSERRFYEDGRIPWLLSGEVSKKEITESSKFITEYGLKNSAAKLFPANTVLVAMYGATAGQAGILRFASTTNQAVCGVYPNDRFSPEFLYYNFLYRKNELVATASGNAQPNISQIKIKNVAVPELPRGDQMVASAALGSLSEEVHRLVENYQRKLESLAELKQSLLQKAFSGELTSVPQDEIEAALA